LPGSRLFAQQEATFSTGVSVVNVFATVRDKQGAIVRYLSKEDFLLQEDGRRQEISYFSRQTDLPLTVGLLVDTSGSQRYLLQQERLASREFLWHVMRNASADRDADVGFVMRFDFDVELLQDLTPSRKELDEALAELYVPDAPANPVPAARRRTPLGWSRPPGGTALFDAILLASDELMRNQEGRKALIILTDGVDTGSQVSVNAAIDAAQRADTLVYAIRFVDPDAYTTRSNIYAGTGTPVALGGGVAIPMPNYPAWVEGRKILQRIARETGGAYFEASAKTPLDAVYERISEELRNQYSLGYSSANPSSGSGPNAPVNATAASANGFRKIRVMTRQKAFNVQAREGYYAR
jgi:VWFA-related protein